MHWLSYLAIHVVAFSAKDAIRKRSLNRFDNMAVLSLEFAGTFVVFLLVAIFFHIPLTINTYSLTFLGLGVLHGLGTVGKINAMNISLTKTTLFSKYNVFFPMVLGFFFLGESKLLDLNSPSGAMKLMALALFPVALYLLQNGSKATDARTSRVWLVSMAQFFIFHAAMDFIIKLNIQPDMIIQAAVFQRLSAAAVTMGFALFTKAKFPLTRQLFGVSLANSLLISIAFFSTLAALTTAPLIIFKPLQKMLTMIIITAIGLFVFGEHKHITGRAKWGYLVTGLGVVLLLVSEVLDLI